MILLKNCSFGIKQQSLTHSLCNKVERLIPVCGEICVLLQCGNFSSGILCPSAKEFCPPEIFEILVKMALKHSKNNKTLNTNILHYTNISIMTF